MKSRGRQSVRTKRGRTEERPTGPPDLSSRKVGAGGGTEQIDSAKKRINQMSAPKNEWQTERAQQPRKLNSGSLGVGVVVRSSRRLRPARDVKESTSRLRPNEGAGQHTTNLALRMPRKPDSKFYSTPCLPYTLRMRRALRKEIARCPLSFTPSVPSVLHPQPAPMAAVSYHTTHSAAFVRAQASPRPLQLPSKLQPAQPSPAAAQPPGLAQT